MLTEPRPNGEDDRPRRRTESVWTEGDGTDEPMACGVQISLGGPLVTVACHLLVPGEHDDEQTEAQPAGCDQTQPPPEVDDSRRLRQVARSSSGCSTVAILPFRSCFGS